MHYLIISKGRLAHLNPNVLRVNGLLISRIKASGINPTYDSVSPRSVAGIQSATSFCEILALELSPFPPSVTARHEWSETELDSEPVIATWKLILNNLHLNATSILFDILDRNPPIIIEMDIARYSIQNNVQNPPFFFWRDPLVKFSRRLTSMLVTVQIESIATLQDYL